MTFFYCEKRQIRTTIEVCKARQCPHADKAQELQSCPFIPAYEKRIQRRTKKLKQEKNHE